MVSSEIFSSVLAGFGNRVVQSPVGDSQARRQTLPGGGNNSPQELPRASSSEEIAEAIEVVTENLKSFSRDLQFRVDESIGETVISVIDHDSGKVIRQIPSEEAVSLARHLREKNANLTGILLNAQA